jgi:RND family efflux transporter MFP subunit
MKRYSSLALGMAIGIAVSLLAVFFVPFIISSGNTEDTHSAGAYSVPERPVFPVSVEVAKRIVFEQRLNATGRARAHREAPIIPQIAGVVQEVFVRDGMRVRKGDALFKIDDREHRIALREAEDRLLERQIEYNLMKAGPSPDPAADPALRGLVAELEENYNQSRDAFGRGELSQRELIHIQREYESTLAYLNSRREEVIANKSGLTQAEQVFERAKLNLSYTDVRAPFDGYIAQLDIQEGMMAQTGREHLKIVDLFTIHIEVGVIESELPLVREGSKAEVRFPALDGRQFTGTVHTVSPLVDDESRTARVTIAIPNPDGVVKSGMFANVEIVTEEIVDALVVPRDAVLARDQRELIFRIENNTAKWHYVSTGRKNRDYVQILDGISAGDTIAVGGHYTLAHDARVTVR